jgi:hypothetical protein
MNLKNIEKAIKHLTLNVTDDMFCMDSYRYGKCKEVECDSVGCAIGHTVVLGKKENIPYCKDGTIAFDKWAKDFYGLESKDYNFLFSSFWKNSSNSRTQCIARMQCVLDYGNIPSGWNEDYTRVF